MLRTPLACLLGALVLTAVSAGCSTSTEDAGSSEAAATPAQPTTQMELAQTCTRMLKRHETVRSLDMREGVIRWGCGDVPGVTNEDLGQEYCEYQVVQGGAIKTKASDVGAGAPISCVFTSVFQDTKDVAAVTAAMADPQNLGAAPAANGIVQMQKPFNSRGAATSLIRDCQTANTNYPLDLRLRNAACVQALGRRGEGLAELTTLCKGDLRDAARWTRAQELGAKIVENSDASFDNQRDIASCMAVAAAGGVMWRNSDPMICSRTARSTADCSCAFGEVPEAVAGLPFTGWVDDHIPDGCRFAKVDGKDYASVVICPVSEQEASDLPLNALYANNLGNFCRDRFGVDLVMELPIRALQNAGTCQTSPGFCAEYMSTPATEPPPATTKPTNAPPATTHREDGAPPAPPAPPAAQP